MLLALAVLPLPPDGDRPLAVLFAVGLTALIVATVILAPWHRLPRFAETVPPLAYFVVIALLRESQGGSVSGYAALAMLPVFWLALYGTRSDLAIGIAGLAAMFFAPLVLLGPPDYPSTEWRRALLWICVAPIVGYTVQGLVAELRSRAEDARRTLAYMASVTAVTREMAGSSDPVAVREAVCSSALVLAGADFAQLIEPDFDGALVRCAGVGEEVEIETGDPSAALEAYVTRRPISLAEGSMHFEPVLRNDVAVGVLVIGWRGPLPELGDAAESGLRMLAAEAAIAIAGRAARAPRDERADRRSHRPAEPPRLGVRAPARALARLARRTFRLRSDARPRPVQALQRRPRPPGRRPPAQAGDLGVV